MKRRLTRFAPLGLLIVAAAVLSVDQAAGNSAGPPAHPERLAPARVPAPPIEAPALLVGAPGGEGTPLAKGGKLDGHLRLLAQTATSASLAGADEAALAQAAPPEVRHLIGAGQMRLTEAAEVQVYVFVRETDGTALDGLRALGARIERVDEAAGIVQAQAPAAQLEAVAALSDVVAVRLPDYGYANAGSVMTEGDEVMRSDDMRTQFGLEGDGVSVGVIADGLGGLINAQGSGDVSAVDTTTCNVTGSPVQVPGAEGTAMLEIVHDVAPGASLSFGHFSTPAGLGTSLDFNAAVTCLAEHVDIVVDDIGFYGAGPYDGTSDISQNTADALNGGGPVRAYFTAVANMARQHYQDDYVDSGFDISDGTFNWSTHLFEETPGAFGTEHAGLNPDPSSRNRLRLQPGGSATVVLVWDDPWGGSANDYDTFYQVGTDAFFCGFNRQDGAGGDDFPVEICSFTNPTAAVADYDIFIGNYRDLAAQANLDLFVLCTGCLSLVNGNRLDFTTGASSVPNQSDAGGSPVSVISMGAVRWLAPNAIEGFSSRGPTNDERLKPDAVAPDGVSVTGSGGFGSPFFGTSAAAPHAAAVAALLLECQPDLTRQQLRDFILTSAFDLGNFGPDTSSGYGRIDALAAGNAANCAHYTPTSTSPPGTPTPAATATPSPTPGPACISGDANASGAINSIDAAITLQRVAGLLAELPCFPGADVDLNGTVNAIDAALILQFVAGLLTTLPV